jgi:hypothetical protein
MGYTTLFLLALCLQVSLQVSNISTITLATRSINAVTSYAWTIAFDSSTNRNNLNLTFPSACTLLPNATAAIGGTGLAATVSGSTLLITGSSLLLGTVTITVSNVQNPSSAISTYSFLATSVLDASFSLAQSAFIQYQKGTLVSSFWSFSACTEQQNSNLTVTAVISNPVAAGNSKFLIGYSRWVNHNFKDLLYGVSSISALLSLDGGSSYSVVASAMDTTNLRITLSYTLNASLTAGAMLMFIVQGVESPPTETTPLTSSYFVATADSAGNRIDDTSSITVASTCIFSLSGGTFANTNMPVNSLNLSPQIDYTETPTITLQTSDTVELHFSPLSNFNNCQYLRVWRNFDNAMQASLSQTTSYYQYTLPSSNAEYAYPFSLSPVCSYFLIPGSETPSTLTFLFKRSGSPYLQLTASVQPVATAVALANATSSLTTYEMTLIGVAYTFSVLTAQPLGSSPALRIFSMPVGATVPSSPSCVVTLMPGTVSSQSCLFNSNTSVITVNFTAASAVAASTNISVVVSGITNPSSPTTNSLSV